MGSLEDPKIVQTLSVDWNDAAGDYLYALVVLEEYTNGERQRVSSNSGDREWAERVAKHYNIEVPEVKE